MTKTINAENFDSKETFYRVIQNMVDRVLFVSNDKEEAMEWAWEYEMKTGNTLVWVDRIKKINLL